MRNKTYLCLRINLFFFLFFIATLGNEPERVYSPEEVAIIDHETKMWRMVNVTEPAETNIKRLRTAGFSTTDLEAIKPRLLAMWDIDLGLHLEFLDRETMIKIKELEPKYILKIRRALLNEQILRLGGGSEPLTPDQVKVRWRSAIMQLLDDHEIQEFTIHNSPSALALYQLTKDIALTIDETRTLCVWQQALEGSKLTIRSQTDLNNGEAAARVQEALLGHWRRMRDLLGDDRFAVYLRGADSGYNQMASVLKRIPGINATRALDLWWTRKKDEIADYRMIWGSARYQIKIDTYEAALATLGPNAMGIYCEDSDSTWLKRRNPYQTGKGEKAPQ